MRDSRRFAERVIVGRMTFSRIVPAIVVAGAIGCRIAHPVPQPRIIPHSEWQTQLPLGYAADATRRNAAAGDSLAFRGLTVAVLGTTVDSSGAKPTDVVRLRLAV